MVESSFFSHIHTLAFYVTVAIAILSAYGGMVVLYKIKSAISGGGKKAATAEPTVSPQPTLPATTGSIPAIDSPAFDKFVESDAFYKMLEDEKQLETLVESA